MAEQQFRASHRFARIAPTKVRRIADLIRRRSVQEAKDILQFMPHRGARFLEKVLNSAAANAADKDAKNVEDFRVAVARVDEGPRMKRIQPHARGMAFPILCRMCHIHIEIDQPGRDDGKGEE